MSGRVPPMKLLVLLLFTVLLVPMCASAVTPPLPKTPLTQSFPSGYINWAEQSIFSFGSSPLQSDSEEQDRSKALIKAKAQARAKAMAGLLGIIDAIPINYAVFSRDLMAKDDVLTQSIEDLARNSEVVSGQQRIDAGDAVTDTALSIPLFGPNGPASALLAALDQQERIGLVSGQIRVESTGTSTSDYSTTVQKGPFTALIVDARGSHLQKALNPRLRTPDAAEIWGTIKSSPYDFYGVAYCTSIDDAKSCLRAGKNPLIVRAIGRSGVAIFCDAVISVNDGEKILAEDKTGKFLDKSRVIFVIGPATN